MRRRIPFACFFAQKLRAIRYPFPLSLHLLSNSPTYEESLVSLNNLPSSKTWDPHLLIRYFFLNFLVSTKIASINQLL